MQMLLGLCALALGIVSLSLSTEARSDALHSWCALGSIVSAVQGTVCKTYGRGFKPGARLHSLQKIVTLNVQK
jgi:uncharacterized membrane protein HdeD (DUF308 family)